MVYEVHRTVESRCDHPIVKASLTEQMTAKRFIMFGMLTPHPSVI